MLEPKDIDRYQRELRAMLRRAGDEDPEGFAAIDQLLHEAIAALPLAACLARRSHGYSWDDLARGLGVSRQSAWRRLNLDDEPDERLSDAGLRRAIADAITYLPARKPKP